MAGKPSPDPRVVASGDAEVAGVISELVFVIINKRKMPIPRGILGIGIFCITPMPPLTPSVKYSFAPS